MFETLLSNTLMKSQLTAAVLSDKPMQAYMLCGAYGSGKKTAARELARALVVNNPDKVMRGTHPDVIMIEPNDKNVITVEQIRTMRFDAFRNPSEGVRKVYIIDRANRINDMGQNALLSVLEQPPSFAVFILLTESREKMLTTVISRCTVYTMESVSHSDGEAFLKRAVPDADGERIKTALRAADGNLGLAKDYLSDDRLEKNRSLCVGILTAVAKNDNYTASRLMGTAQKGDLYSLLGVLAICMRDILVYKTTGGADSCVFCDSVLQNAVLFDKIDTDILYNCIKACYSAQEMLDGNVLNTLVTEGVVIQMFGGEPID